MIMQAIPTQERPRERLSRLGAEGIATYELLAIILGTGTKSCPVLDLSLKLLSHFGSLSALAQASLQELQEISGIGKAKALQLQAALHLGKRMGSEGEKPFLNTPEKIYRFTKGMIEHKSVEHLLIVLLDAKKRHIHTEVLAKGTLTELITHPREIFGVAMKHRSHSFALVHNHPSGDPTPSSSDLKVTKQILEVSSLVQIPLLEHLIIGKTSYVCLLQDHWI